MTEDLPQKGVKYIKINFSKFQLIPVNKLVKIYCEGGQFIRRWNICLKMALARSRDELRHALLHVFVHIFDYIFVFIFYYVFVHRFYYVFVHIFYFLFVHIFVNVLQISYAS